MPSSGQFIFAWQRLLDELTYYELFRVEAGATADEVQAAFHVFCDTFHPDRHFSRSTDEREALSAIFKRGTEAYHVLSDDVLRGQYDTQLAASVGSVPPRVTFLPKSRPPPSRGSGSMLDEAARTPAARPFAHRAEELLRRGDLRQAKLQLVMANHLDPGNAALEAALRDVDLKLR